MCLKEQKRFCKIFGFEPISLKQNILKEQRVQIDNRTKTIMPDSNLEFEGVDLSNDILSGALRYTLKSEVKSSNDLMIFRKSANTSFIFAKAFKNIIEKESFSKVLMSHGIYCTWGTLLSVCKQNKIETIVWGRGYIGQGNIMFGHNHSTHDESINEDSSIWKNIELDESKRSLVYRYYNEKVSGKSSVDHVNYYEHLDYTKFETEKFFNSLKNYKRSYGMFTNIPWDGQVFNKTEGFPSTRMYLENTINWFVNNPDCLLVIRSHPAEKARTTAKGTETFEELLREMYPVLPGNVIFLEPENPITSYRLAREIDVAILYGSTLSLEFAVVNIPVIQTGKFNVNGKNIVFEVSTKEEFWTLLDRVKNTGIEYTEEMRDNIVKYAYYWIYRRHIEDTSVRLNSFIFENFTFDSIAEFKKDTSLSFITDCIIKNKKIILPN